MKMIPTTCKASVIAAILAMHAHGQDPFTNGLVAHYPFNGDFKDKSGRSNDATSHNATFTTDRLGNTDRAAYFDGISAYLKASATGLPTTDRTVSLWLNTSDLSVGREVLGYGGGASFLLNMNNPDGAQNMYETQGHGRLNRLLAPITDAIGIWHHWVVTVLGTRITLYIDGIELAAADSFAVPTGVDGKDLIIGAGVSPSGIGSYSDANGTAFNGSLDELRIYSRALPPEEVRLLYDYESPATNPPTINLAKAVRPVFTNLTVTTKYQLQVSTDLVSWTNHGAPFIATDASMIYPEYFDVQDWGSLFFRLAESP